MKPILYLGCPAQERAETEQVLAAASLAVIWADSASTALSELQRHDMPVLLDLSRGAAALQIARELHDDRAATLIFAVVDPRRPDLTTEAVLAGMADVFARPIGGRRVANAIARELGAGARNGGQPVEITSDDLYHHSPAMRDVMPLIERAATMRAGVLVRGEDGVGRQAVARAIHAAQVNGSGAAFVCVDCAAHETDDLEAELFGAPGRSHGGETAARGLERVSRSSRLHDANGGTSTPLLPRPA